MRDIKIPWTETTKGDLVVLNGRWKKIKSIEFLDNKGNDVSGKEAWASSAKATLVDVEDNETDFWPVDPNHSIRVRPVAPDPWMGRRKEGKF